MDLPFVSVIIPVLNGEHTIRNCLTALLHMNYPQEAREIIVVDNGSTDRTKNIVNEFPIKYVWEDRRGLSNARNSGIKCSHGQILAFTDSDCYVTKGWLRELVLGFDSDDVGVVVGEVIPYPPKTNAERYMAIYKPLAQKSYLYDPKESRFIGACFAVRRKLFEEIGLFDPQFAGIGAEDIDFSWRFRQHNRFKLTYSPKALVVHDNRPTARRLFIRYFRYSQGRVLLMQKHPQLGTWAWSQEIRAYRTILSAVLNLVRSAIYFRSKRGGMAELSYQYFELVRKLAWRIGFTYGKLRGLKP